MCFNFEFKNVFSFKIEYCCSYSNGTYKCYWLESTKLDLKQEFQFLSAYLNDNYTYKLDSVQTLNDSSDSDLKMIVLDPIQPGKGASRFKDNIFFLIIKTIVLKIQTFPQFLNLVFV